VSVTDLACSAGRCTYACAPGFADCAGDGTGCQTDLTTPANCGACGHACAANVVHGSPACVAGACGVTCQPGYVACGEACVEPSDGGDEGGCAAEASLGADAATDATVETGLDAADGAPSDATDAPYAPEAAPAPIDAGATIASVSAASGDWCAVTVAGAVECWGDNAFGQLGNGTQTNSPSPVAVTGLTNGALAVATGGDFACAIAQGGAVECWGNNGIGQLGNGATGNSSVPVQVTGLTSGVTAISVGGDTACAITQGGGVQCWGNSFDAQLGNGAAIDSSNVPVQVTGLTSGVTSIAVNADTVCAVTAGGGLECWGFGVNHFSKTPEAVPGFTGVATAVSVGADGACVLVQGGNVECWGSMPVPEADGSVYSSSPASVSGLGGVATAVSVGSDFACAVTNTGTVECWASPYGTVVTTVTPTVVSGLDGVTSISAGGESACVVTGKRQVECFGEIAPFDNPTPVTVHGLSGARAVAAGQNSACAVESDGGLLCWGANTWASNGYALPGSPTPTPVTLVQGAVASLSMAVTQGISGLVFPANLAITQGGAADEFGLYYAPSQELTSGVTAGSAGADSLCALTSAGAVSCWGDDSVGQLGDNADLSQPPTSSDYPSQVYGLTSGATAVSVGTQFACAIVSGSAKCWGDDYYNELGSNSVSQNASSVPVQVSGVTSGAIAISAGNSEACALLQPGALKCWGRNSFQAPYGLSGVSAVSVGNAFACVLTSGGGVQCWGANGYGVLGNDTGQSNFNALPIPGLASGVTQVAAGNDFACALTAGGVVKCWGAGSYGQLGDGVPETSAVPSLVTGF
jgi:alpha-tubulin suppressor-like RCC1 family protein